MKKETLLDIQDIITRKFILELPKCGVYFLIQKNKIVYVGSSTDIQNRIWSHRKADKIPFDSFYFIKCNITNLRVEEIKYIIKFNPVYNSTIQAKNYTQLGLIKFSFIKQLIKQTNQTVKYTNVGMFGTFFNRYSKQNTIQKLYGEGNTAIFLEHEILKIVMEYYKNTKNAYDIFFRLLQETKNGR